MSLVDQYSEDKNVGVFLSHTFDSFIASKHRKRKTVELLCFVGSILIKFFVSLNLVKS
jgi:hypothetical protein